MIWCLNCIMRMRCIHFNQISIAISFLKIFNIDPILTIWGLEGRLWRCLIDIWLIKLGCPLSIRGVSWVCIHIEVRRLHRERIGVAIWLTLLSVFILTGSMNILLLIVIKIITTWLKANICGAVIVREIQIKVHLKIKLIIETNSKFVYKVNSFTF